MISLGVREPSAIHLVAVKTSDMEIRGKAIFKLPTYTPDIAVEKSENHRASVTNRGFL